MESEYRIGELDLAFGRKVVNLLFSSELPEAPTACHSFDRASSLYPAAKTTRSQLGKPKVSSTTDDPIALSLTVEKGSKSVLQVPTPSSTPKAPPAPVPAVPLNKMWTAINNLDPINKPDSPKRKRNPKGAVSKNLSKRQKLDREREQDDDLLGSSRCGISDPRPGLPMLKTRTAAKSVAPSSRPKRAPKLHSARGSCSRASRSTTVPDYKPSPLPRITVIDLSESDGPVATDHQTAFEEYLDYRKGLAAEQPLNDNAVLALLKTFEVSDILVLPPSPSPSDGPATLKWGKKNRQLVQQGRNRVILPLHHAMLKHWTVVWFDFRIKTVYHIDSCTPSYPAVECKEALVTFAGEILPEDHTPWKYDVLPCRQHVNSFDCGIFIVVRSLCWMLSVDPPSQICCKTWRQLFRDLCDIKAKQFTDPLPDSDRHRRQIAPYEDEYNGEAPAPLTHAILPGYQLATQTLNNALKTLNEQIATSRLLQDNRFVARRVLQRAQRKFLKEQGLSRQDPSRLSVPVTTDRETAWRRTEADQRHTNIPKFPTALLSGVNGNVEDKICFQNTWDSATLKLMCHARWTLVTMDGAPGTQADLRRIALEELAKGIDELREGEEVMWKMI